MALHPQVQQLQELIASSGQPPLYELPVEEARKIASMIGEMVGPGPEIAAVTDLQVPGAAGDLPARLYQPATDPAPGLIVYFHGGGWTMGATEFFDAAYRKLALASGLDLLSVDYRLAPEHPFPAAIDDAYASLCWAAEELAEGRPLVVGGDSAGGNLATVCALRARDQGGPRIALQLLVYPVTDHVFDNSSYTEHGDQGYLLGRGDMVWFWDNYAPESAQREHPDASPLRAADLAGLPPALIIVAEFDPLRDEVLAYAERLGEAGVEVDLRHYDDVVHGFFTLVNYLERGDQVVAAAGAAIATAIAAGQDR
jgi:acetyl esterase